MSSLDRDELLEGSPAGTTRPSARSSARAGSSGRAAARTDRADAGGAIPAQRTTAKATSAKRAAKATAAKSAPAKATPAKATPAKATPAKATPAKATPAKATPAKATPAKASPGKATPAKRAAKATAAKSAPAKVTPATATPATATPAKAATANAATAKATAAKATSATRTAAKPGSATRPRPTPRPRAAAAPEPATPEPATPAVVPEPSPEQPPEQPAAWTRSWRALVPALLRLRPPGTRRRPGAYLVAALVGAMGLGLLSSAAPIAQAAGESHSVSVARELGVASQRRTLIADTAPRPLEAMVASRAQREAQQQTAAHNQDQAEQQARAAAEEAARNRAVLPVNGAQLTSCFCMRWGVMHEGIDLAAPMGTPEYAAMDGVVLKAGPASGYGLAVYIQHRNGDVTVYGHMEQILVKDGQVVHAGDTIALLGNNGQSTGPHLHFEVHAGGLNGPPTDPIAWLRARGVSI